MPTYYFLSSEQGDTRTFLHAVGVVEIYKDEGSAREKNKNGKRFVFFLEIDDSMVIEQDGQLQLDCSLIPENQPLVGKKMQIERSSPQPIAFDIENIITTYLREVKQYDEDANQSKDAGTRRALNLQQCCQEISRQDIEATKKQTQQQFLLFCVLAYDYKSGVGKGELRTRIFNAWKNYNNAFALELTPDAMVEHFYGRQVREFRMDPNRTYSAGWFACIRPMSSIEIAKNILLDAAKEFGKSLTDSNFDSSAIVNKCNALSRAFGFEREDVPSNQAASSSAPSAAP